MSLYDLPIKTYVVHAKTGYEYHGERVVKLFKEQKIPFEFGRQETAKKHDRFLRMRLEYFLLTI